jgi:excisionase family DNA binding protein
MDNTIRIPMSEEMILTRTQVAEYLHICKSSLDRAGLPSIRIGRRILYRKTALDQWLERHEKGQV